MSEEDSLKARPVFSALAVVAVMTAAPARVSFSLGGLPTEPLPPRSLTIVAPAAPGGGWDQLAREMQREIELQRLVPSVRVENIPGAAGTIGLAQLVNTRRGDGGTLMVNGLVMLGAILWNRSPVSLAQATPIARLTGEFEVVAVPASSPHQAMRSVIDALRANAAAVSWGGGSAGGTDHILAGLIVAAAGIDPRRTNYIAFSGGGEAVTALLGSQVTAGISGYSEFRPFIESGRLRAIAISSPQRQPVPDVPTLREQGLDVELENWRAVVAAPGLDDAQRRALTEVVDRMAHSGSWRATVSRLGWRESYLSGPEFERFLDEERVRVGRIVSRLRGPADPSDADSAREWLFPLLVFVAGAVVLVMLLRGRLARAVNPGVRPVAPIVAALLATPFVLNRFGFVLTGSLLFVVTTSTFGSRRWVRDVLVAVALCGGVYFAFTKVLGVTLP